MDSISRFCDSMMLKSQEILHWKIVLETKDLAFSLEILVLTSRIYYINAQMTKKFHHNFEIFLTSLMPRSHDGTLGLNNNL